MKRGRVFIGRTDEKSLAVNSILKFPTCVASKHRVFNIEFEKTVKYGIVDLTELLGANNTWDQAER